MFTITIENFFLQISYIVDDGNLTHPSFMIHFKSELKNYLGISL